DRAGRGLLSLSEAVARLRDEKQPRAREAAGRLDEFIRSRNLDSFAKEKTDYYYRADQIPRSELEKLAPADKQEFAVLERQAGANLREVKEGVRNIDRLRLEIEKAYNEAGKQAPPKTNRSIDGYHYIYNPLPERNADPERDRVNDRRLLGDVIIAHALADCAALDHKIARDHGKTFRLKVYDQSLEDERRISNFDVYRRAGARGQRAADERGIARGDERRAVRSEVSERDVEGHQATLKEHGRKLEKLVGELESKAQDALDAYQHARRLAQAVVEQYERRGEALPTPLVEREALVKAQEEAIEHRFPGHTDRLERLRIALAEEHGQALRPDREAARLAAQLFTARTELQAREERATRFNEMRHLRQWEIGGEKLSLADVDRRIEQATDNAQFVGKREFHLLPGDRRKASAEVERLGEIRGVIIEKIGERQRELREKVGEAGRLLDTLAGAYDREASLREQSSLVMPGPQFTRQELDRAADNIETTRDAAALRELTLYERQLSKYADPKEQFKPVEGWGRAPARAQMAEIFHRENSERLSAFRERGSLQPLLVETSRGLVTHRIKDTEPRSLVEMLVRTVVES